MQARIEVDWGEERAVAEWGGGTYTVRSHRHEGARTVYEYETPQGEVVRCGGFRSALKAVFWLMMRECE